MSVEVGRTAGCVCGVVHMPNLGSGHFFRWLLRRALLPTLTALSRSLPVLTLNALILSEKMRVRAFLTPSAIDLPTPQSEESA